MSISYDQDLDQHRKNVLKGFEWLVDNLSDFFKGINIYAIASQILMHDDSKTSSEEYNAYNEYFYGGNRSFQVVRDFQKAWLHHIHNNPHHGIKGQKWGVRNGPPYPLDKSSESGNIKDVVIGKSLGAKSHNYDVLDPNSNEYFQFSEGTRIRHAEVFAGKGASKPLNPEVAEGLSEQIGGNPDKWQHCKGIGTIDVHGEDVDAEVHWFQEESVGKHKFKIKKWED